MPSVGSITYNFTPVTKTAAYTALNGQLVLADATSAAFTITLPATPVAGMQAAVKKTDSGANAVTVISGTAATIDGDSSAVLLSKNSSGTFVFDGTNWKVVATSVFNTATSLGIVPAGGTSGQALVKTSGTDYAYGWAAAGGYGPWMPWTTGRIMAPPFNAAAAAYATGSATQIRFFPIQVPNAVQISAMGFYANTSGSAWLGLYSDAGASSTSQGPGALVGGGVITLVTAPSFSWYTATISLSAATYWVGHSFSTTSVSVYSHGGAALMNMLPTNNAPSGLYYYVYATATGGANPGVADYSSTSMTGNNGQTLNVPIPFFKVV